MCSRRRLLLLVLLTVAVLVPAGALGVSGTDTITTIAGTGNPGYSGDGGQATSAELNYPEGVAVDTAGNVYVGDDDNNAIRRISNGIVTTIAGTGAAGYSGDGGQATSAQLRRPNGVAVDGSGDVYVADTYNHVIRKIANGVITTIAGTGAPGYSGDGGQATSAELDYPYGVAVDGSGNVYIADYLNNRIRKVANGIISTIAGNGTPGYSGDGGQATSAQLRNPFDVAVDNSENVYIADTGNNVIRRVGNGIISTVAGTGTAGFSGDGGPATAAQLNLPEYVALDSAGNLYISDTGNHRIRKVANGVISTLAGTGTLGFSGDGGPASAAQLYYPTGAAVDGQGSLYLADEYNQRLRKIENKLPVVDLNAAPSSGQAPLTVSFDGSRSSDPDGSIVSYQWSFGDGASASGATASHRYAAGTYKATLTVTDDSGATATATRQITASSPPPPPPPPPPPTKLKLTASRATVGKAVAGKAFTVSITVTNARTGKGVRGLVSCAARLAGKPLALSSHSSAANGKASCSWRLPKSAHGKRLAGFVAETYRGVKVSRPFSVRVA